MMEMPDVVWVTAEPTCTLEQSAAGARHRCAEAHAAEDAADHAAQPDVAVASLGPAELDQSRVLTLTRRSA